MPRLQGKVALVTGGGTGIGRATAELLAAEGAAVVLMGRRPEPLAEVVAAIVAAGGQALACPGDVSDEAAVAAAVADASAAFGGLDVVVNNAGSTRRGEDITRKDRAQWDGDLAVNLTGPFLVLKHAIPHLIRRGGGSIVNIASQLALVGAPGYVTYSAAKGGLVSLTRTLAVEYGPLGIRCNCICPGLVETAMAYVDRPNFDELREDLARNHPLRRLGQPRDVAHAVLYLASDESAWVTGVVLPVDGGFTAR